MDLRVLLVGTGIYPIPPTDVGAIERHIYYIAREMAKAGIEVHVVSEICEELIDAESLRSITFHKYKECFKDLSSLSKILNIRGLSRYASIIAKSINPDIIHFHTQITLLMFLEKSDTSCKLRERIVFTEHNTPPVKIQGDIRETIRIFTYPSLDVLATHYSRCTIAVSRTVKRALISYGADSRKIVVIPNGVDTNLFNPKAARNTTEIIRENNEIEKGDYVLYVGRLDAIKGADIAVKSFYLIKNKEVKLIVIGSGKFLTSLKFLIEKLNLKDRVIILGKVPHQALPPIYANSTLLLHTSYGEGLPLVVLEALASGLPVVSTLKMDVLFHGINGFIAGFSIKKISEYMSMIIEDRKLRERLSHNARKVAEFFDWKNVAKKIIRTYESILS